MLTSTGISDPLETFPPLHQPSGAGTNPVASRSFVATVGFAAAAMLVSYLPFSAVNGVLGTIDRTTGAPTGSLQWVTDAFIVALTSAVFIGGSAAERQGRRRITVGGLLFTTVGSIVGWLAGSQPGSGAIHLLWTGQAICGFGAGMVMAATLSLIGATAPSPDARTRSIAVWAACNVVGLGAGPFLAGAVTGTTAWPRLFVPVAALAVLVAAFGQARSIEVATPSPSHPDRLGQLLGTLAVVLVVYGVISGGSAGWIGPRTLFGLCGGAAVLVTFVSVERRAAAPVLPPALFTARGFTASAIAAADALFTVIGVVFVISLYLAGRGVNDLGIAERLGCLFAGNALASAVSGPLQTRLGSRRVLLGGLVLGLAGLATLVGTPGPGLGDLAWRLVLLGAGCGSVVASSTALAVQSAPGPLAGKAGTANNVIRQLGGALGTAVIGAIYAANRSSGPNPLHALHASLAVLLAVLTTTAVITSVLLLAGRRA